MKLVALILIKNLELIADGKINDIETSLKIESVHLQSASEKRLFVFHILQLNS